jgi:hypothetical protein
MHQFAAGDDTIGKSRLSASSGKPRSDGVNRTSINLHGFYRHAGKPSWPALPAATRQLRRRQAGQLS